MADLELERAARLREIARAEEEYIRSKGLRGLTEAEGEQLRAKQAELTEQKKAIVEWDRRREVAARRLKDEEDAARSATELLDIDAQMVRTQAERHRIEREILLATIEIARKRKAFELENDPELDDQQRGQQMATFNRGASRRVELFDHQETERLRAQFKSYGREVTDAIREGRIGEYIGDQLKQRLLDGALDQLFNLFNGGSSSKTESGGWVSFITDGLFAGFGGGSKSSPKSIKKGRAAGGRTEAGEAYEVVEHGRPELFMIGGTGHVTSAAETARMLRETMAETGGAAGASAAPVVHMPGITIHAAGADPVALIRRYDTPETLFYLDPPYWGCEGDYGADLFGRDQFAVLAAVLASLKGRFLLSLNDRPEVRETFGRFHLEAVKTTYSLQGGGQTAGEVIIRGR